MKALSTTAAVHADAPALIFDHHMLTWAQVADRVVTIASRLAADGNPIVLEARREYPSG